MPVRTTISRADAARVEECERRPERTTSGHRRRMDAEPYSSFGGSIDSEITVTSSSITPAAKLRADWTIADTTSS